jgi:hypothetical protein
MSDKAFRILLLKMINDLEEDSNKQINKLRKSVQDPAKKVSNMDKKFSLKMDIVKENKHKG